MSPRYTPHPGYPTSSVALMKARKILAESPDDRHYRNMDRLLARAYIELQKRKIQQRRAGVFMPRMDLCDDPQSSYITAMLEVPGMNADHLSVRIENGRLIVEGERTGPHLHVPGTTPAFSNSSGSLSEPMTDAVPESSESAPLYPVRELKYGKFRRDIPLPAGVNATHVRSTLVEGMLTISWPRDPSALVGQPPGETPYLNAREDGHTNTGI